MTPIFERLPVAHDVLHFLMRCLRFQRHLVTGELQHLLFRAGRGARAEHLQPDVGTRFPADQLHDIVEAPADDVREVTFVSLAHAGDAIVGVQRSGDGSGAALDHVHDGDVVVDELQRGADALVVQAHLDAVLLGILRREVARMRVERARVRVHQVLEHVLRRDLVDSLQHTLVALLQQVGDFRPLFAREHQRQRIVLHALAPQIVHLLGVSRARALSHDRTRRTR